MTPLSTRAGATDRTVRFPRPPADLILPNLLARRAEESGAKTFVTEVDGESLTYAETYRRASRLAHSLRDRGVRPGDRVVTLLPNSVDSVVVLCASALAGAIHVPLNNAYLGAVLQHAIRVAQPTVIIVDADYRDRLHEGIDLPDGCVVVWRTLDEAADPTFTTLSELSDPRVTTVDPWPHVPQDWADTCTLLFTSGTTGSSKAVTIPWLHLYLSSVRIWQAQELDEDLVMYSPWPVNHISGSGAVYMSMIVGGSVVVREKWSTSGFVDDVRRHQCTAVTLMSEMVGYVERMDGIDDLPLTHVFVAPVTSRADETMARIGARYATNYNSTELCSPIGSDGWNPVPVGSCGILREEVEMRIVDEDGNDVPDGTPGEALFRTADPAAMNAGYWGMPDASAKAWRGGWFHTGDLLRRDADGHLYFVGRLQDRLRSRGENVSPDELEAIVLTHPSILQCAAVGRPNEVGEDDIVLYVVPADGLTLDDVAAHCEATLPKFMRPAEVRFAPRLPETPTGKIRRGELRAGLTT